MNRNPAVAIVAPSPPPYGGMSLQAERLNERLRSSGIKTLFIKSNASFPFFLKFLEKIYGIRTFMRFIFFSLNLLQLRRVTVVHLFGASYMYFFLVVVPSILAGAMMNKRVILNYRGGEAEKFLKKFGSIVVPLIRKANIIAVPSVFLKEILEKAVGRKPVILPNLIDIEIFRYRERKKLKPIIIISRQLEPRYNISCALRAFKIIKNFYSEANLKIAGTGSEERKLKKLKDELSLKDVHFLGSLSHKELSSVYDECDIMMNSSNVDNFPGSILEAFACGLPVVTTKAGGIPFMVKEGETGILVEPNDHEGLAKGVMNLLEDYSLATSFSKNGRRVAEEYTWEKVKNVLFKLYGFS